MYWIDENSSPKGTPRGEQKSFFADAVSDVANLPTSIALGVKQGNDEESCKCVLPGSSCLVIATSEVYILNSSNVWTKL
jgi:hypothetical protein